MPAAREAMRVNLGRCGALGPRRPSLPPEAGGAARPPALLGSLVPAAPWAAPVIGAFPRAVALLHPDGALVSIVADGRSMEARAVAVGARVFGELARALGRGTTGFRVGLGGTGLELVGPAGRPEAAWALDFAVWDASARLRVAAERLVGHVGAALERTLDALERAFVARVPPEGIHGGGPFARRFAVLAEAEDFPRKLAGFGPGTTPAGDDFIAGWQLAARLSGLGGVTIGDAELGRTTAAGRALLLGAREGCFPAYLLGFAEAFSAAVAAPAGPATAARNASTGSAALDAAMDEAFRHGASSGADALLGFLRRFGRQGRVQPLSGT
ncbi:MAG: DUF2877 domain-containing protein [Spirochaetales bacterium]|nr:DUF2877 domain-containing protein [Spirochaetales bacterium]